MSRQAILTVAAIVLLVGVIGCERTNQVETVQGDIELKPFAFSGAIPAEYGRLVGVTSSDTYPGWAQLWFERADSSIVTVFVNYQNGIVRDRILEIPRS
jgi:hypothetical protein